MSELASEPVKGFTRVCALDDLDEGKMFEVEVGGEQVAIICSEDSVFAVRNVCSHAAVPLTEGEVDGYEIECWMHGACFDLRTGECLNMPVPPVPVYQVRIEGADVLVSIEES